MFKMLSIAILITSLMACNPTVRIESSPEPIRIIADITIKHEIKIVVEKDVEEVLANDDLF